MTTIPTLELAKRSGDPVRVEHIVPSAGPVDNDVHRHDYDELFFFAAGTGTHMIDLEQRAVASPGMHLVGAGQVHQLSRSADMRAVVVQFGSEALLGRGASVRAELFARADRPCAIALEKSRVEEAQALVALIEQELMRREKVMDDVVRGYLDVLLIKCAQWVRDAAVANGAVRDEHDPVRRFQELVEQGYLQERQVAHYADRLALSSDRLNELVRKRLGRTASSVIHERLLLEARRLLLHSELSIKEVGYALNLQDPAYFARWFRKADGRSPAEYRQHIREKYQR